jgi:hypothetical protein
MAKIMFMAITALVPSVILVLLLIWRAAEGREDKKGFHPGSASKPPEAQANNDSRLDY